MINTEQIREHMEVRGADNVHLGVVDRVEGNEIKLSKNDPRRRCAPFRSAGMGRSGGRACAPEQGQQRIARDVEE
jgi:hypothetical protein